MRFGRWCLCAAAFGAGCDQPQPASRPPTLDAGPRGVMTEPEEPSPVAEAEASGSEVAEVLSPETPSEKAPATATIAREGGRTIVATESKAEEILVVPTGVVWAESGSVWRASDREGEPEVVSRLVDPHGLATNGRRVYWLGDEKNEQLRLDSGEVSPLPPFYTRNLQETLAFGDALYGRSDYPVALWQIGRGVKRLPFRPEPGWHLELGLGAGKRKLFLPASEMLNDRATRWFFIRFDIGGALSTAETGSPPVRGRWAVNAAGDLAFVADDAGSVAIWPITAKTARVAFEHASVEHLCWCGTSVCTLGDGAIHRHPKRGAAVVLASDVDEGVRQLSCGFGRIGWTSHAHEGTSRIVVM